MLGWLKSSRVGSKDVISNVFRLSVPVRISDPSGEMSSFQAFASSPGLYANIGVLVYYGSVMPEDYFMFKTLNDPSTLLAAILLA